MQTDISRLQTKVKNYNQVLQNTNSYRQAWQSKVKQFISTTLKDIAVQTGLKATIVEKNNIENLEAIVLDLGRSSSGIAENIENTDVKRIMVKNNGAMIYQQLFQENEQMKRESMNLLQRKTNCKSQIYFLNRSN